MSRRSIPAVATLWIAACGSSSATKADAPGPPSLDAGPLPPDPCSDSGTCPAGSWINVTPSTMPASALRPTTNAFGPGSVVADPSRPSDLYVGPNAGLWKSTDYGSTWQLINSTLQDAPRGVIIAVAGTSPATIWSAGYNVVFKSTDGGNTFKQTNLSVSLYSLKVDPYDPTHLISGLHEADGVFESIDGGITWNAVGGAGFPSGGISWYPYFIDTGDAVATRKTWFAIAQDGASAITTTDGGAHWTIPTGISGLQHPHGNSQIFQNGTTLYVGGVYGPGQGIYRSPDRGVTWSRADTGKYPEAVVWGTPTNIYAMYAWACSGCNLGTDFEMAPEPGTAWSSAAVPPELTIGPNSVAVTFDGVHHVFVAVMWDQGIWRYVEP
jgi:photosystem II stability/assembly factor-like uncharacterized protein